MNMMPQQLQFYLRLMTKLPLLCICEGVGSRKALFWVRTKNLSSAAATLTGAPSSFHLGSSSVRAWGSSTFPDKMWAPAVMDMINSIKSAGRCSAPQNIQQGCSSQCITLCASYGGVCAAVALWCCIQPEQLSICHQQC